MGAATNAEISLRSSPLYVFWPSLARISRPLRVLTIASSEGWVLNQSFVMPNADIWRKKMPIATSFSGETTKLCHTSRFLYWPVCTWNLHLNISLPLAVFAFSALTHLRS